jgi:hypothetical protein
MALACVTCRRARRRACSQKGPGVLRLRGGGEDGTSDCSGWGACCTSARCMCGGVPCSPRCNLARQFHFRSEPLCSAWTLSLCAPCCHCQRCQAGMCCCCTPNAPVSVDPLHTACAGSMTVHALLSILNILLAAEWVLAYLLDCCTLKRNAQCLQAVAEPAAATASFERCVITHDVTPSMRISQPALLNGCCMLSVCSTQGM